MDAQRPALDAEQLTLDARRPALDAIKKIRRNGRIHFFGFLFY
ncbi:hypothetical protein [Sporosarcina sp. SAFN-015]